MRLHLDHLSGASGAGQTGAASGAQQTSGAQNKGAIEQASGSRDSVTLSGPSAALGKLASDRAARVQQLTAAVRGGSYQISSAAISGAIVSQSFA